MDRSAYHLARLQGALPRAPESLVVEPWRGSDMLKVTWRVGEYTFGDILPEPMELVPAINRSLALYGDHHGDRP